MMPLMRCKNRHNYVLTSITSSNNEKRCILQINPSAPQMNTLLKILKENIPIRPVVNIFMHPSYKLAKNKSIGYNHNIINSSA
jgi:hypothetical protein